MGFIQSYACDDDMKNRSQLTFHVQKSSVSEKGKSRKSFSGCLSCKQRKRKCDEMKPSCTRCTKGKRECVWPGFCTFDPPKHKATPKSSVDIVNFKPSDKIMKKSEHRGRPSPQRVHIEKVLKYPGLKLNWNTTAWPLILNTTEMDCFSYFLMKFLPSLSHPFAHDMCFEALFIDAASNSDILRDIFIACGATMIAFENEAFKQFSHNKFTNSVKRMLREIKSGRMLGSEEWLFIAVQVLQVHCFRENVVGLPATTVVPHIIAAFQIIKKRSSNLKKLRRECPKLGDNRSAIVECDCAYGSKYSSLDRALIENFLFNYPITIFFGKTDIIRNKVPNPFDLFSLEEFWQLFNDFEREYRINRLSKFSFEVAAKAAWLCRLRLPLNESDIEVCRDLYSSACSCLEDYRKIDVTILNKLSKQSVSISKIVLTTGAILLKKMLHFETLKAEDFQLELGEIVDELNRFQDGVLILPGWTLLISTCTSVDKDQRKFFRSQFDKLLSSLNSNMLLQIINFVDSVYELDANESFELLFDTGVLDIICS